MGSVRILGILLVKIMCFVLPSKNDYDFPGHIFLENPVLFWGTLGYVQETIEPLALSTYSYVLLVWYACTYVCINLFTGLHGNHT